MNKISNNIMKIELLRFMKGNGMKVSLIINCLIVIEHLIRVQLPMWRANKERFYEDFPSLMPNLSSGSWLCGGVETEAFLFFLLLPILAGLPYAISFFDDCHTGYIRSLYMRVNRADYLKIKFYVGFLSGFLVTIIPLLISFGIASVLFPNLQPGISFHSNGISNLVPGSDLYFRHPSVYMFVYILFDGLAGGFFSCLMLVSCFFSDYRIVILLVPFFLQLFWHIGCSLAGNDGMSTLYFLQAGYGARHHMVRTALLFIVLLGCMFAAFRIGGENEDVY